MHAIALPIKLTKLALHADFDTFDIECRIWMFIWILAIYQTRDTGSQTDNTQARDWMSSEFYQC